MPMLKAIFKKPLNLIGLDLVRYHPRYSQGQYAHIALLNIRTVIDVGAHMGEFAKMIAEILPGAAVVSFEPLKEEFRQLEITLKDIPNGRALNLALGDRNESLEIHRSSYAQSSSLRSMTSLHKEAFPESAGETRERVEVRRLDEVLAEITVVPEILLKIDVQGYEDKVLAGAPQTLARSKAVIIEVSFRELYDGQPLFDAVYRTMFAAGFAYAGNLYQLLHPTERSVLQADALFIRP